MTRPRNETAMNLENERAAALAIERAWDCDVINLHDPEYRLDWALARNGIGFAYAEYKHRGDNFSYRTVYLSASKYSHGIEQATNCNVSFLFFVETTNGGLRFCDLTGHAVPRMIIGGNSRGQDGDIETCMDIPYSWLQPVCPALKFVRK